MREIKFRLWNKDDKKMVYGESGGLKATSAFFTTVLAFIQRDILKEDSAILMQYTGLKDKNGKEVFRGDIIDIHQTVNGQNLFRIDFDEKILSVKVFYLNGQEYEYNIRELLDVDEFEKEIEVVGNIYENPVLLNKQD